MTFLLYKYVGQQTYAEYHSFNYNAVETFIVTYSTVFIAHVCTILLCLSFLITDMQISHLYCHSTALLSL